MTKDVFDCIRDRRSVRSFKPDPVPEPTLTRILEAGCLAPSAGNVQPWYFYVVRNQDGRKRLAKACYGQQHVAEAPVAIVVLADTALANERYGERGAQLYCLQDTAAAVQNMLLAAEGLGLNTCWVGAFDEPRVQEVLEAPPRLRAVAIICLGYGKESNVMPRPRRRVTEVTKFID